jgi:hypothetical protein
MVEIGKQITTGKVDKNNKRLNNRVLKLRRILSEISSSFKKRNYAYGMS